MSVEDAHIKDSNEVDQNTNEEGASSRSVTHSKIMLPQDEYNGEREQYADMHELLLLLHKTQTVKVVKT